MMFSETPLQSSTSPVPAASIKSSTVSSNELLANAPFSVRLILNKSTKKPTRGVKENKLTSLPVS